MWQGDMTSDLLASLQTESSLSLGGDSGNPLILRSAGLAD
jgi:hypothetical protein